MAYSSAFAGGTVAATPLSSIEIAFEPVRPNKRKESLQQCDLERLLEKLEERLDERETSIINEVVLPDPLRGTELYLAVQAVEQHYGGTLPMGAWQAWRGMLNRADEGKGEVDLQQRYVQFYVCCDVLCQWVQAELVRVSGPEGAAKTVREMSFADHPDDKAVHSLLRIFTNGHVDGALEAARSVINDGRFTANEKLFKIARLIPIPPTASGEALGEMLGVSKQAVFKTEWWTQHRKGEKADEVGRRHEVHRERAKNFQPHVGYGENNRFRHRVRRRR